MSVIDGEIKRPGFADRLTRCRRAWAHISADGQYRYRLGRDVREDGQTYPNSGYVLWIMLNPSTADAFNDDNTIRRCVGFTRQWGYPELQVANVYAYRSTDPAGLWAADDPAGPENPEHLRELAGGAALIIAAWGRHARKADYEPVADLLAHHANVYCLGFNKDATPRHPLMLHSQTARELYMPKYWRPAALTKET